ncbi:MAG: exodeoxyribonuclease VII small subunit [Gammaproteobacteria bacterium]
MAKKSPTVDFERALEELETLVEKMETGELSLEESLQHFERGVSLTKTCQKALSEAEQRVKILLDKEGKPDLAPFTPPPAEGDGLA